ncbi:MAG TPA: hypothetical protein VNO50_02650 [Pyrinomonadaceae bacterium]|nr:hypothetical protein [Pyrinomonadaceae bacterium]
MQSGLSAMTPKPKKGIVRRGAWEVTKKLLKAIPIIGPVFTVGFAGRDIHKKGLVPGAVHVALDVTPVVGTAKNVLEIFTGDLIPDKDPQISNENPTPPGAEKTIQPS